MWIRVWTPRQRQPCERQNAAPLPIKADTLDNTGLLCYNDTN